MIANWLNEEFLKTVVLFELPNNNSVLQPHGTGVLINYKENFVLVTCRHIVVNPYTKEEFKGLNVILNRLDGGKEQRSIEQVHREFGLKWVFHHDQNVDIAVTPIAIKQNEDDIKLVSQNLFENFENLPLGEDVFFLGYPLGLGVSNENKSTPLIRAGLVSAKLNNKTFLIDANVYPGSSGSPVFYRPTIASFSQSSFSIGSGRGLKLLGIISDNLNYIEDAVSTRTGQSRIQFQENAGLGIVQSTSLVTEILDYPELQQMLKTEPVVQVSNPPTFPR